jgi:GNAT superfamily N-acetyltransferase
VFRQATLQDVDALVQGNIAMARETEGLVLDPRIIGAGVRAVLEGRQTGRYYVWEEDGEVVAQLMITFEWSDWRNGSLWWIQSVYVPPKKRRKGYYRRLYAAVREEARNTDAPGLRLYVDTTNKKAQKAYEALGMNGDHYRVFEEMFEDRT